MVKHLNQFTQIKKYYNQSLKIITQSFRISNILIELGPTLEEAHYTLLSNQITRISQIRNNIIFNDATNYMSLKRKP